MRGRWIWHNSIGRGGGLGKKVSSPAIGYNLFWKSPNSDRSLKIYDCDASLCLLQHAATSPPPHSHQAIHRPYQDYTNVKDCLLQVLVRHPPRHRDLRPPPPRPVLKAPAQPTPSQDCLVRE